MRILTVDIGTGTQDIFLFDSRLDVENGFKMVLPSPTMIVHQRLEQATREARPVLLTGVTMGGGPSAWAAEAHAQAGIPIYATPDAARTMNDDLALVAASGITIISEDEAAHLPADVLRIELHDFDFRAIADAFARFGVDLTDLSALAIGVFDHGAAPADISDRKFRFDYLDEQIRANHRLSAFAFSADQIPARMTRLQAVASSASRVEAPLVVMDTAPAAVLGATFDPHVRDCDRVLIANVGNMHTLAFRLGPTGIEGVFEHHTGLLDQARLEAYLTALADGKITNAQVFNDHGHGALIYSGAPLPLDAPLGNLIVTGPRRGILSSSRLKPIFATPFGDMMIAGCFGLLAATGDCLPNLHNPIQDSLSGHGAHGVAPWDLE